MFKITGKNTEATFTIDNVEEVAIDQVRSLCNHPACTEPIVIMPDVHAGCASPIGFTMPLGTRVVPNIVSVDIGCGMTSVKYDILAKDFFNSEESKAIFDKDVRKVIPMGFNINNHNDRMWSGAHFYNDLNDRLRKFHVGYCERFGAENASSLKYINDLNAFKDAVEIFGGKTERIIKGIASLGGGNHFGECSEDNDGYLWITIHCGSRNFGKQVCDHFQNKAWKIVEDRKLRGKQEYIESLKQKIADGELCKSDMPEAINEYDRTYQVGGVTKQDAFLEGTEAYQYLYWMVVAQCYSDWNRELIHERIATIVGGEVLEIINTTHNYISFRDFIIRKGAVASYEGEKMIIPFNSRDGILICTGKSNKDFNYSCCHGAGRVMSRSRANKVISREEADRVLEGVYASERPLDESPLAYKDSKMIEVAISPTANIVNRLKPIVNFKAK